MAPQHIKANEITNNDCDLECHFPECKRGAINVANIKAAKQWPIKLKLVPEKAEFFEEAKLLLAADCASCVYASFYKEYIHGRTVVISCPKFDDQECTQKLSKILLNNNIRSLMVVRMDVPCCAPLEQMAIEALNNSGKFIPWQVVKISTDGEISEQR